GQGLFSFGFTFSYSFNPVINLARFKECRLEVKNGGREEVEGRMPQTKILTIYDSFTSAFVSTVGIDFKVKTVFRQDKRVKLQIWDTAGQERYRTITTAYYRGAMGFILMYDITNEESFNSVQDWVTQIKTYSWDNAQVILVGNKCDMEDERIISYERGKQLADQLGVEFFETSAKENINVKAVFERLVDIICDKMSESLDSDPSLATAKGTRLTGEPGTGNPQNGSCQC
ncbi:unnamed protein product, partial [Allacma fusca]